jgi:hypothetical protein
MRSSTFASFVALLLIIQPISPVLAASFKDTDDHRYEDEIEELADEDIVEGVGNSRYEPNRTINRAEFATILVRALFDEDEAEDCLDDNDIRFSDVRNSDWYAENVCLAEDEGIIKGYPDGTFRPTWEITYAEATVMVTRALDTDVDNGYEWFDGAIEAVEDQDADPPTVGNPHQYITRGEVAYLLYNMDILDEADEDDDDDDDDCEDWEDDDDCDEDDDDDDNDDDEEEDEDAGDDLTLIVSTSDSTPGPGEIVTYTIRIENDDSDDIEVDVLAELLGDATIDSVSDDGDENGDDEVEWQDVEVSEDESEELELDIEVDDNADDGDELEITVTVDDAEVTLTLEVDEDDDGEDDDDNDDEDCDDDCEIESYHTYSSSDINSVDNLSGDRQTVRADDLYEWDRKALDLVRLRQFPPTVAAMFYASMTVAQRDAISIGERARGSSRESVDWVSAEVVCRFSPVDCVTARQVQQINNSYAQNISNLVMQKIDARIQFNASAPQPAIFTGATFWNGSNPLTANAGNWQAWIISPVTAPVPPVFGSLQDTSEVDLVRQTLQSQTTARLNAINRWAGGAGTDTPAGLWLRITDDLLDAENADMVEAVHVRSAAMMAAADAYTSAWKAKFTYWTPRPFMRSTQIIPVIATPNSPSYVSAHATVSAAVAIVLSDFYPDDEDDLLDMAEEAADSRFWAGVNFRHDTRAGLDMGERIGEEAIDWHEENS